MLTLPVILVMEYAPSKSLYDMDFGKWLQDSNPAKVKNFFLDIGNGKLKDENLQITGRIMSFDVLINNWDRIPLIWEHDGNLGNLLIAEDDNKPVIAIDQCLSSINPELFPDKNLEYTQKVRLLLSQLTQYNVPQQSSPTNNSEVNYLGRAQTFFKRELNVDIGDQGQLSMLLGLVEGFLVRLL